MDEQTRAEREARRLAFVTQLNGLRPSRFLSQERVRIDWSADGLTPRAVHVKVVSRKRRGGGAVENSLPAS